MHGLICIESHIQRQALIPLSIQFSHSLILHSFNKDIWIVSLALFDVLFRQTRCNYVAFPINNFTG